MLSVPLREEHERNTFSVGLIIALASWALMFVTLAWGYLVYRMRSSVWISEYLTPQITALAVINTAVIVVSSFALSRAFKTSGTKALVWAWGSFVWGIFFLVGQFKLWHLVMAQGLNWKSSHAGSFFFLLTGFHAVHAVGGLGALLVLCLKFSAWKGAMAASGIRYFWDFLYIVWVCLFVMIFIIR